MIKKYFKQAWWLLKENKLYSTIYIIGTALAICMVMVISIYVFLKRGDISPEVNRSRSLYVKSASISPKDTTIHDQYNSLLSIQTVKRVFYPLESAETVTATYISFDTSNTLSMMGVDEERNVVVKYTDANYWKAFQFHFLDGSPYDESEFASGVRKIVIDESTSRQFFNGISSIGKILILDGEEYRVSGVVRNSSYMLGDTFANVWVPFTCRQGYDEAWGPEDILGEYRVVILAPSAGDFSKVRKEVEENLRVYERGLSYKIDLLGQPDEVFAASFRVGNVPLKLERRIAILALLTLIFAMVPVLNLAGLNSSRMEKRSSEIGVRKAFGGTRGRLAVQMITENLLLTAIGGFFGYIISYFVLSGFSAYMISPIVKFSSDAAILQQNSGITMEMMLNTKVFLMALLAIFVINLLSTLIPSYRYSKKNIVEALSEHKH